MLSMYMVTHKNVDFIPKGRHPIFVGDGNNEGNYLRDNTGENIAYKNVNLCELTAYYWIWKNDSSSEYVSIEHYRRFFMPRGIVFPCISTKRYIENELTACDVVTSREYKFYADIWQFYEERHYICDLELARQAIVLYFPEYLENFNKIMHRKQIPMFNMIAMSKENFDRYCEWLFTILFYIEERTDVSDRSDFQKRIYGFVAERLLEVWIETNHFIVKRNSIYKVSNNILKSIIATELGRIPIAFKPRYPRH